MGMNNTDRYDELPSTVQESLDKLVAWERERSMAVTPPSNLFFVPKWDMNGKAAWAAFVDWNARHGMQKSNRVRCRDHWVWRIRNVG
jgi:hypothetical protein